MFFSVLSICAGASLGAVCRWLLGLGLNSLFPTIPPGTVVANLVGGYIIGAAMTFFASNPGLAPEWRLFIITGFLGALTTFSTFSAEMMTLIQQGRLLWAAGGIALHLGGALIMTFLGIATVTLLQRA